MGERPRVVLALTPVGERAIEELVFGSEPAVVPVASAADGEELAELAAEVQAEAVLLSPELSGLTAARCARVRAAGLRVVGIALDETGERTLAALAADRVVRPPASREDLLETVGHESEPAPAHASAPARDIPKRGAGEGTVVCVLGSKGAPGASECAASLAALAAERWPALLVELDALGGGLDLRLDADPRQGSVLGLVRAAASGEAVPPELVEHWLAGGSNGWPPALVGPPDLATDLAELSRPGAVAAAIRTLTTIVPLVVCDVGWLLVEGGEAGPVARIHREAVVSADAVLLVFGARDEQLRNGLAQLDLLLGPLELPPERLRLVVNGIGAPGAEGKVAVADAVALPLAGRELSVDDWLQWDGRALARARRTGVPLALARRRGPYARAVGRLLDEMFVPVRPAPRRRRLRVPVALAPVAHEEEEVELPWRSASAR
jgi:hypothetical protein